MLPPSTTNPNDSLTIDGVISQVPAPLTPVLASAPASFGPTGLNKVGTGLLILNPNSGINAYSGGTTISAGALRIQQSGALDGLPSVQQVAVTGSAGSTFTLDFEGDDTDPIDVGASASDVATELNALNTINANGGGVNVTYDSNTNVYTVAFNVGPLADSVQPLLTLTGTTGDANATIADFSGPPEVQSVTVSGPTSGTFTLTFEGQTTAALPVDSSASSVASALDALSTIKAGGGAVDVAYNSTSGVYAISFDQGPLATSLQPELSVAASSGVTAVVAVVSGTTVEDGASLQLDGSVIGSVFVNGEPLTLNGTGTTDTLITGTQAANAGALENFSGSNFWEGPVILATDSSIGVDNAADSLQIDGVVQDPATGAGADSLVRHQSRAGTLIFTNANTYTGETDVDQVRCRSRTMARWHFALRSANDRYQRRDGRHLQVDLWHR